MAPSLTDEEHIRPVHVTGDGDQVISDSLRS